LLLLNSSQGNIYIELFPDEAPENIQNILDLTAGNVPLFDEDGNESLLPYYDGVRFHRVIPGFVVQAGSPVLHQLGAPQRRLNDEINADFLGMNAMPAVNPDGTFHPVLNVTSEASFANAVLRPLYRDMNIDAAGDVQRRQYDISDRIRGMTVKDVLENQGYRYTYAGPSRAVTRGVVALANKGPDSNGPEFFIALQDAPWLTGRHTVIGRIVEGMSVIDSIGRFAIDPLQDLRSAAVIYSAERVN